MTFSKFLLKLYLEQELYIENNIQIQKMQKTS